MTPPEWLSNSCAVRLTCLGSAIIAAIYLLVHSMTFHHLKRRMADLLLIGIGLADLSFVSLEALKILVQTRYFARGGREEQDVDYKTGDFVLTLFARFSFFMSLYWIAILSLLIRLGSFEALHTKRNLMLSSLASLVYGCMHAILPMLSDDNENHSALVCTVTAMLLFLVQTSPLVLILTNLQVVRKSRCNVSAQGRNVIRRLTTYCVSAAVLTLPYSLGLIISPNLGAVGFIAETLNYLVPIVNALLFGTSLSCCCAVITKNKSLTTLEKVQIGDNQSLPIPVDIDACLLTDGIRSPSYTPDGLVGYETLLNFPIAEMKTEGPAEMIGEGSSGEVYKAQWLGITVALKCLRLQAGSSSEADMYKTHLAELRTEFLDEAQLASQLRHPNITLFIKMGFYRGRLCLVKYAMWLMCDSCGFAANIFMWFSKFTSEYCARGSLRDVLRSNYLVEWHTKVRLAFEAAKGLAFMHNREPIYLHRDLKASNILVTAGWTAKIADFGIARVATNFSVKKQHISQKFSVQSFKSLQSIDEGVAIADGAASELHTTFAGTWRWNAPEVMSNPNECRFNRETDVYSFGIALWEILTNGKVPFGDVHFDHQVRQLVTTGKRPSLPSSYVRLAPPEFIEVMCACWHDRPEKRPKAQDIMLRLGSLSHSLSNSFEFFSSSQSHAHYVFSDSYYQAINSIQSCPGL